MTRFADCGMRFGGARVRLQEARGDPRAETRDEAECAGGAGGSESGPTRRRRCMSDRGYAAQEARQGSYLELREMQTPAQTP